METRDKVIDKIKSINNESVLQGLLDYINLELHSENSSYKTSDVEKRALDEGLNDLEKGRIITNTEAQKMTEEWLKKK